MSLFQRSFKKNTVTIPDLSERQAAFVAEYVKRGGKKGSATKAALAAGYSVNSPKAARVRASELLRNPKIISALRDELMQRMNIAAVLGVNVLIDLAQNGPPHVRLSAAKELIDRGYIRLGLQVVRTDQSESPHHIQTRLDKLCQK